MTRVVVSAWRRSRSLTTVATPTATIKTAEVQSLAEKPISKQAISSIVSQPSRISLFGDAQRRAVPELFRSTQTWRFESLGNLKRRGILFNVGNAIAAHEGRKTATKMFTRPLGSDRFIIFMGLTTILSGYVFWQTNRERVFLNKLGRIRVMALSWDTERILGQNLQNNLDDSGDQQYGPNLPDDDYRSAELVNIGNRILQAAQEDFFEIRGRFDWRLYVRDNAECNAHCQAGGTVTVYTGMFDLLVAAERAGLISDARAGLACVLAHEIAHGLCRHTVEHLSWLPLEYPLKFLASDSPLLNAFFNLIIELPYSRICEQEADLVGLELMARAGYNPEDAPKVFKLLGGTPEFLEFTSTHPSPEHRASLLAEALPRAMEVYRINRDRFETRTQKVLVPWLGIFARLLFQAKDVQAVKRLSTVDSEERLKRVPVKRIVGSNARPRSWTGAVMGNRAASSGESPATPPSIKRLFMEMDSLA